MATNTNNGKKGFTLDETTTKLLLVVGGLVILFLSYQFGYRKFQAKASELDVQTLALGEEVASLLTIQQNADEYTIQTSTMKREIEEMLSEIEAQVGPEDRLMFAVDMESETDDIEIMNISSGADTLLYTMNAAGNNAVDSGKALYSTVITLDTHTTYTGLKDVLQALIDNNDKVSIEEASFSVDEDNGGIVGNVNVDMFYLVGTEREYTPYKINGVETGNQSLFGEAAEKMSVIKMNEGGGTAANGDADAEAGEAEADADTADRTETEEE